MHTNEPLKGTLSEGALAPLLGGLQRTRASGWLRVSSMTLRSGIPSVTRFGLRLQEGRVVAVEVDEDPLRPLPADLTERATAGLTRILACRDAVQSWDPTTEVATLDPAAPLLAALALRAVDRVDAAVVEAALGDADSRPPRRRVRRSRQRAADVVASRAAGAHPHGSEGGRADPLGRGIGGA